MSDIFISYSSRNREQARRLAEALGAQGWSVWWDHEIQTGQRYDQVIEQALHAARAVVVLWSEASVDSEWVKNEATVAAERGVLLPANLDGTRLPLAFRARQTADLQGWAGDASHPGFQSLCRGVRRLLQEGGGPVSMVAGASRTAGPASTPLPTPSPSLSRVPQPPLAPPHTTRPGRPATRQVAATALALVLAVGGLALWLRSEPAGSPGAVPTAGVSSAPAPAAPAVPADTREPQAAGSALAPADAVAGTYMGDIVADSQGGSRSGVEVTVTRLAADRVRVASADARIGSIEVEVERVGDSIMNRGAEHVLLVDLNKRPLTLQWNPRHELAYAGQMQAREAVLQRLSPSSGRNLIP